MNLKEAKQNNKLSQLIKEREKKTPANRKSCLQTAHFSIQFRWAGFKKLREF